MRNERDVPQQKLNKREMKLANKGNVINVITNSRWRERERERER